ncbi:hypothetical protein ABK040_011602 [Willaertia magna]
MNNWLQPTDSSLEIIPNNNQQQPTTKVCTATPFFPKNLEDIPKNHPLDHYYYHQLKEKRQDNNNNPTSETMNIYRYKSDNQEQSKSSNNRSGSLNELDEVVQQSMQESSGVKKEIIEDKEKRLLFFGFNQTNNLFSVGTEQGFYVYSVYSLKEKTKMLFHGGIGIVEMLFKSNIFALVGGGKKPAFAVDRVILWEDSQKKCISEIPTNKPIRAVKLHKNLLVIVVEDQVIVYDHEMKEISRSATIDNPTGIVAISPDTENIVLAYPAVQPGMIRVEHLSYGDKKNYIKAHESKISQIALNRDGTRLASASEKGTLVRVFDTSTGELVKEVRRGSKQAKIYSLAFSDDSNFLCCSSDTGTIHVFSLIDKTQNRTSSFSFVGGYIASIFTSEWSFGEYRGAEVGLLNVPTLCAFVPRKAEDDKELVLNVLTALGDMLTLTFDISSGNTAPVGIQKRSFLSNEEKD